MSAVFYLAKVLRLVPPKPGFGGHGISDPLRPVGRTIYHHESRTGQIQAVGTTVHSTYNGRRLGGGVLVARLPPQAAQ